METNRSKLITDRLRLMRVSCPDIIASVVVSVDGLPIASVLPETTEEERVSAMSAAMLSLGDRIAQELGQSTLEEVYIKGNNGYVLLMAIGQEAVLTVIASHQAKLGMIFLEIRKAISDLAKLI